MSPPKLEDVFQGQDPSAVAKEYGLSLRALEIAVDAVYSGLGLPPWVSVPLDMVPIDDSPPLLDAAAAKSLRHDPEATTEPPPFGPPPEPDIEPPGPKEFEESGPFPEGVGGAPTTFGPPNASEAPSNPPQTINLELELSIATEASGAGPAGGVGTTSSLGDSNAVQAD